MTQYVPSVTDCIGVIGEIKSKLFYRLGCSRHSAWRIRKWGV